MDPNSLRNESSVSHHAASEPAKRNFLLLILLSEDIVELWAEKILS